MTAVALHMKAPETYHGPRGVLLWPGSHPNSEVSSADSGTPRTLARCARCRELASTTTAEKAAGVTRMKSTLVAVALLSLGVALAHSWGGEHADDEFGPPQFALSAFGPGAGGWSSQNRNPRLLADITADGNADIVGFGADGVYVSLANGTGGFVAAPMFANGSSFWGAQTGGWSSQDTYPRELADVNNDQIADIVGFASNGVYVSRGDVIGFFAPESAGAAFWGVQTGNWSSQDTYSRFMADADGDGKPDIVGFAQSGVYVSINTSTLLSASFAAPMLVPDSSFWGANTGGWSSQDAYPRELANITNGDTMADIVGFAQNGVWTALAGATTFFAPSGGSMLDQGTSSGVPASSPDVALLSQYMAGSFATSSDGNGGTLTDAALTTQPTLLTPPPA